MQRIKRGIPPPRNPYIARVFLPTQQSPLFNALLLFFCHIHLLLEILFFGAAIFLSVFTFVLFVFLSSFLFFSFFLFLAFPIKLHHFLISFRSSHKLTIKYTWTLPLTLSFIFVCFFSFTIPISQAVTLHLYPHSSFWATFSFSPKKPMGIFFLNDAKYISDSWFYSFF